MSESGEVNTQAGDNLTMDEEDIKADLIQAVKLHPDLYNPSSHSNRNKFLREKDWKNVSTVINKEELWCRNEWRKLKDNYSKKKKAVIGKTGQARKKIESWPHFASMQFLDDHLVAATTSGNLLPDSDDDQQNTDQDIEADRRSPGSPATLVRSSTKISGGDITYSNKRNRTKELDSVDQEFVRFLKQSKETKETKDSFHHFGMSVAEDMRKMDPPLAAYVKMRISQVVYEAMYPPQQQPKFQNT